MLTGTRRSLLGVGTSYIDKVLGIEPANLVGLWPQNESVGSVSLDKSVHMHNGAYTDVTLGQPGVPGSRMTSAGYNGATSLNNIHTAGFANDDRLPNGGFETAGAGDPDFWANWTENAGDGALANEIVIVHEGTDACKMTSGLTSNTRLRSTAPITVVPGMRYRWRLWSQGDGANAGIYEVWDIPNGRDIIPATTTGVTGAAWGMSSIEFTAPAGCTTIYLYLWCPPVNGGVCYFDAMELRRMDGFLGDQGTIIVPAQVANVGVWTDGIARQIIQVGVDGPNYLFIRKTGNNNEIQFHYRAGGILELQVTAGLANIDFASYGMTWDVAAGATGEVRYYIRGVPSGAMDVGLSTWVGDLSNTQVVIGASTTVPANVWSGNIGPVPVWNKALTADQMAYLS